MYNCHLCRATSEPKTSMLKHVVYRKCVGLLNGSILAEYPTCPSCKEMLDGGIPHHLLLKQGGRVHKTYEGPSPIPTPKPPPAPSMLGRKLSAGKPLSLFGVILPASKPVKPPEANHKTAKPATLGLPKTPEPALCDICGKDATNGQVAESILCPAHLKPIKAKGRGAKR